MATRKSNVLVVPSTKHSIEDRRALTSDALKVAKHELEKEFKKRVKAAHAAIDKAEKESIPAAMEYNLAVVDALAPVLPGLRDDLEFSINRINSFDESSEDSLQLTVIVHSDNFIPIPKDKVPTLYAFKPGILEEEYLHAYVVGISTMHSMLGCGVDTDGDSAYDLEVLLRLDLEESDDDGDFVEVWSRRRMLNITCSSRLSDARHAVQDRIDLLQKLRDDLKECEKQLNKLPELVKELDISATVMRVRDAGGSEFLSQIINGANRILGGDIDFSGASMALECGEE